jgi:rare lipoprotein A
VTVKISDRGPAVQSRIIDVSAAAARKLAMQQDGVVEVRIDVIDSGRLNNIS